MDNNSWRPSLPNVEPTIIETSDFRTQLPPDSRQKIVNKIMETLKNCLPFSGPEGNNELRRTAARFEEKIFSGAVDQTDYLRKISMKLLTIETNYLSSIPATGTSMDSIPANQGHLLPGSLPVNQSQPPQPLLSQTMLNISASGITGSTALPSSMPPVSSITNKNITSIVNQKSYMQNVAGMLQDSSGQHGLATNMFSGSQRPDMPHGMSSQQQQQPQSAQYLYQQNLQQQLLKQNFQPGSVPYTNSLLPSDMQHEQHDVLQPNQMHSCQLPGIPTSATQPSTMNSAALQGLHTNQQSSLQLSAQQTTQSMFHQHQSSLLRSHPQPQQALGIHQQQTSLPVSPLQQQQTQMMRQHVVGEMQQQHQPRLVNQQNNIMNIQQQQLQQQPPAQQQLMSQQNSIKATHEQLGTQSNVMELQQPQQQLLSSQVGNSSLQTNKHSVRMLPQPTVGVQRIHQTGHGLFSSQGQQSQNQPSQQQVIPQLQSHQQQLGLQQQQVGLQQQPPNLLQQDVQQRLQASGQVTGSQLPPQDHHRQLYQSESTLPVVPSSLMDSTSPTENANGGDWQEEVFQKIKSMKQMYLQDLNEIYQRVTAKLKQQDSLPQHQRSDQFEKLKQFKTMLERMIQFLSFSKSNIIPALKDKVAYYENQIISLLDMHNNVLSSRPGVSVPQQNITSFIPAPSLESGKGIALNRSQQVAMGSMQQNISQRVNNNTVSTQNGLNTVEANVNQTQLSSSLLQHQHLKQQQDRQMTQKRKQKLQQCQMEQLLQKQQVIQQQHQQQLQARQQPAQIQQMNDMNDLTTRQGMNVNHGMFPQDSLQGLKPGTQLSVSSPQLLHGTSLQMTQQHLSPPVDQTNMSSINKMGTPLQPANSPFLVSSPSTPMAPSPMQVDAEKPSGASLLSMENIARQQATGMQGVVQSLAIGTPGISASPFLQEFNSPDGNNSNVLTSTSGKPSAAELPIEHLIRALKSISSEAFSSAVSDIGSVVSMVDRVAGSSPGNGLRASVGEDVVAVTKCHLQARNDMTQEGMMAAKKMKRYTTAVPLSVASLGRSVADNYKQYACSETSDLESTATSDGKKARTGTEHALLEEIKEINQLLIDTVVEISDDEDAADFSEGATASKGCEGTTVRFSFIAVSLSPALKTHLSSTQMSPIQPLRLLVPCSYPNGSPSLLDKLPVETSKGNEDLSAKAMARFNILLKSLSQPLSLKDLAKTWDACARTVICEYSQQYGGGTFSSKYGTWENFVTAS